MLQKRQIFLAILITVHVVCGIVLGYLDTGPNTLRFVFIGLSFSQTSLLGIWGGLAIYRWPRRLVGTTTGLICLLALVCFSLPVVISDPEVLVVMVLSTTVVTVVLLGVRRWMARLESVSEIADCATGEGLQFTIRHIMLLTLFVACTITIGRGLQPYIDDAELFMHLLLLGSCFVLISVISIWATLGRGYVLLRSFGVLVFCLLAIYGLDFLVTGLDFWTLATIIFVHAISTLASLYVVRLCGYRMIRVSYASAECDISDAET